MNYQIVSIFCQYNIHFSSESLSYICCLVQNQKRGNRGGKKQILKHAKRVCQRNVTILQLACDDKSHEEGEEQQVGTEGEEPSGGPSPH